VADLVSYRDKQTDLRDLIETAANNNTAGLTMKTHHKLVSEYDAVSRYDRRQVMGDPFYYCEVIGVGPGQSVEYASGESSAVPDTFDVWLVYEYTDAEPYAGSSQEAFDNIAHGLNPRGVLHAVRQESIRSVGGGKVSMGDPIEANTDIIPLGSDGGTIDRAHRLQFQVTIIEPS